MCCRHVNPSVLKSTFHTRSPFPPFRNLRPFLLSRGGGGSRIRCTEQWQAQRTTPRPLAAGEEAASGAAHSSPSAMPGKERGGALCRLCALSSHVLAHTYCASCPLRGRARNACRLFAPMRIIQHAAKRTGRCGPIWEVTAQEGIWPAHAAFGVLKERLQGGSVSTHRPAHEQSWRTGPRESPLLHQLTRTTNNTTMHCAHNTMHHALLHSCVQDRHAHKIARRSGSSVSPQAARTLGRAAHFAVPLSIVPEYRSR